MIEIAVKHQTLSNLEGFCPKEHRKNQRKCPTFLLKEFEKNLFFVCDEEFWNSVSFNLLHTYYYFIYLSGWDLIWTHNHWILFRHSNQLSGHETHTQEPTLYSHSNFIVCSVSVLTSAFALNSTDHYPICGPDIACSRSTNIKKPNYCWLWIFL